MKKTSIPEQTIFFYIRKLVDPNAKNNSTKIGKYVADISLSFNGQLYDIEYDSHSQHKNKTDSDIKRNLVFADNGYFVIRMRDKGLEDIPHCININFDFQNYSKNSIIKANTGINNLLHFFGVNESVNIADDLELIKTMYDNA